MEMSQLQNFIVVAEEENITKAADLLLLSQSALSRSIHNLEKELGVPLFDRKNRKIILNRYGRAFLLNAKQMVQHWDHSRLQLKELIDPTMGSISIAYVHSLGLSYIPAMVKIFKQISPSYSLSLQEGKASTIIKDLLTNTVDFGFGTQYKTFPELEYTTLFTDRIVLIAAADHPFVKRQPISIDELEAEPFISYTPGTELKKLLDSTFSSQNRTLHTVYEGLEINSIVGLVKENEGVAFIADSVVSSINGIEKVDVDGLTIERPIYLIHKKQGYLSKAALAFKQFMLEYHGRNG
ncbi:LysR family transcriptional regulator [Shouchella miscanthi]|uniref:LysR family transcriptional regulator n=1 Tax=Shouchella miscanthi TaxID=2598861 RepID=A0ABU6NMX6_9BACI|nr:LysR family transcriptional regulator [Shouchella miscanthi]